jgi:hypothetical protein
MMLELCPLWRDSAGEENHVASGCFAAFRPGTESSPAVRALI